MGVMKRQSQVAVRTVMFVCMLSLLLAPLGAMAQSVGGAIAGVARDSSGAVLPGVTVEVASPALIEGVRTATTDEQGSYKILELRPGTYTVTFTLPGFSVVKREGLELNSGFTATVNGDMRVGGLEETITVQGASPGRGRVRFRGCRPGLGPGCLHAAPLAIGLRGRPAIPALARYRRAPRSRPRRGRDRDLRLPVTWFLG